MIVPPKSELMQLFNEPTYAWELLQWEIAIEMNESLSGQAIARLLELYMRGVQKMNSLMDIREGYFRNKVTSLMMKGNVVKTLNKPPMAKKEKALEMSAKAQTKSALKKGQEPVAQKKPEKVTILQPVKQPINSFALQQKKREIEMRLAYEADASSRQTLSNMYNQHIKKEETFTTKVKGIINDHQQRLKQRISRRKLRTATYRSRPEDTSDTFPVEENGNPKKQLQDSFSPMQNGGRHIQKIGRIKKCQSLDNKVEHDMKLIDSPKKQRKNTFDYSQVKQYGENSLVIKMIQQLKAVQRNKSS